MKHDVGERPDDVLRECRGVPWFVRPRRHFLQDATDYAGNLLDESRRKVGHDQPPTPPPPPPPMPRLVVHRAHPPPDWWTSAPRRRGSPGYWSPQTSFFCSASRTARRITCGILHSRSFAVVASPSYISGVSQSFTGTVNSGG